MSKIKLPHASGNSMSIAAPATNPASDLELKFPATVGTAGQVLKNSSTAGTLEFGSAGKILQVQNTTVTATATLSCISSWEDSSVTCSLTPASSDSKILISISATGEGNATNQQRFDFRIKKAISGVSTTYLTGAAAGSRTPATGVTGDKTENATTSPSSFSLSNYLDSPSTTSAVTYTLQVTYELASASGTYYLNRNVSDSDASGTPRFVSWITLMEVSG